MFATFQTVPLLHVFKWLRWQKINVWLLPDSVPKHKTSTDQNGWAFFKCLSHAKEKLVGVPQRVGCSVPCSFPESLRYKELMSSYVMITQGHRVLEVLSLNFITFELYTTPQTQGWDYSVQTLKPLLFQHSFVLKQHLLLPMTLHRTVISTDIVINCFGKHITNCTQEIKTELQLGTVLNQKLSSSYLPLLTKQYLLSWVNEMIKD